MQRMIRAWFAGPENGRAPLAGEALRKYNQTFRPEYTRKPAPGKQANPHQKAAFWHNALQLAGLKEGPRPLPLAPAKPCGPVKPIDWRLPRRKRAA